MPCPTVAAASKNPKGSPVRMCSGSMRKCPRLVSGARISHERSARPPSVIARPGRPPGSVVGLWISSHGFGTPAAVAERVRHAHPVTDVAVQLAHRVAGLEVRQAKPDEHVRPADDEDHEVEQVEEERLAGREGGNDQDRREDDRLEPSKHRAVPLRCRLVAGR